MYPANCLHPAPFYGIFPGFSGSNALLGPCAVIMRQFTSEWASPTADGWINGWSVGRQKWLWSHIYISSQQTMHTHQQRRPRTTCQMLIWFFLSRFTHCQWLSQQGRDRATNYSILVRRPQLTWFAQPYADNEVTRIQHFVRCGFIHKLLTPQ